MDLPSSKLITFPTILSLLVLLILTVSCGGSKESNSTATKPSPEPQVSKGLTQFSFLKANNPSLTKDVMLNISGNQVTGRIAENVSVENLVATFTHDGSEVIVNNVIQSNNVTSNNFFNIVTYKVKSNDGTEQSYQVDLTKFTGLPIIYLTTKDNAVIDSKDDYVEGVVSVEGGREFNSVNSMQMEIRGRGNSTWFVYPKKPFQMKLEDKTPFLDMPKDKKWLFLAEYADKTMLRNTIAFEMGHISNLEWTPQSRFAEVYINNEYNGTYNITQKVEKSSNRVDIGDTGYLLEIDQFERLGPDDVYFKTNKFLINIKEPELEYGSTEYHYIDNYINQFEKVLLGPNFKDPLTGYAKYIDVDSFVDWYLISEITKNVDSKFYSSIFFNLVPGEKIKMGPLWDFDFAFGNVDYADSRYVEGYWVKEHVWFTRLFQDPLFVEKIKTRFAYFKSNQQYILNKVSLHAKELKWAQQSNDEKWQTIGVYVWPNPVIYASYNEAVADLISWYTKRMNWLENAFNAL
jgi:spore coat protein CotH